jgi:translation elongation factor P/translation initiation factor 5A
MFLNTMKDLRDGVVIPEIDEQLKQLVADVRATGKGGKLTITLAVNPLKQGANHMLSITDDIKVSPPARDRESTILYATEDNELSRRDPRQPELKNFRETAKVAPMPPTAEKVAASHE